LRDQVFLASLQVPSKPELHGLRRWLQREDGGQNFIRSKDYLVYEGPTGRKLRIKAERERATPRPSDKEQELMERDLVNVGPPSETDIFTLLVIDKGLFYWDRMFGTKNGALSTYSEDPIFRGMTFTSTLVASMLPVAAVW